MNDNEKQHYWTPSSTCRSVLYTILSFLLFISSPRQFSSLVFFLIFLLLTCCIRSLTFFLWRCDPTRVMTSSFLRFLYHTQRRTTVGRTPLDEWSARRRDLYLTTRNTHNRQTSMPPVGFEPRISAGERSQIYASGRAGTGTSDPLLVFLILRNLVTEGEKLSEIRVNHSGVSGVVHLG